MVLLGVQCLYAFFVLAKVNKILRPRKYCILSTYNSTSTC